MMPRDAYGDPERPDLDPRPDEFTTAPRDAQGRMVPGPNARRILARLGVAGTATPVV